MTRFRVSETSSTAVLTSFNVLAWRGAGNQPTSLFFDFFFVIFLEVTFTMFPLLHTAYGLSI